MVQGYIFLQFLQHLFIPQLIKLSVKMLLSKGMATDQEQNYKVPRWDGKVFPSPFSHVKKNARDTPKAAAKHVEYSTAKLPD